MESYNRELNVTETYDWYNFKNNDKVDDLMKIPESELNEYMKTKIAAIKAPKKITFWAGLSILLSFSELNTLSLLAINIPYFVGPSLIGVDIISKAS